MSSSSAQVVEAIERDPDPVLQATNIKDVAPIFVVVGGGRGEVEFAFVPFK